MGSFSRRFDAWSYKRLKSSLVAELVEPSSLGGSVAICGGALLAALFTLSALAYLSVGLRTETAMAPGTDAPLRLTLNVTFPQLPCHLAAVEVIDVLGRRRRNVTANLRKFRVDGETGRRLLAAPRGGPAVYGDVEGDFGGDVGDAAPPAAEADPPGVAVRLTHETFAGFVGRYDVSLVAYGASWCPFSRRLSPVLDEVAGVIGGNADVRVAKVDCTDPAAMLLCAAAHIQAYPTMILYRGRQRGQSAAPATHSDVHYHGDRTAQAILSFLVAAQQDESLGREDPASGPDGGQHGAEQHAHAEAMQRELGLLPPDAAHQQPGGLVPPPPPSGGEAVHVHGGGKPRDPADPGPALALIEAMHKRGLTAPGDVARAALSAIKQLVAGAGGAGNGTNATAADGECDDPAKKAAAAAAVAAGLGVAGSEGCQIAGYVEVARVPGSVAVVPPGADDAGLSVDAAALNLTHVVHELFFSTGGSGGGGKQGGRLTAYQLSRLPRGTREELHRQAGSAYVSPPSPRRVSHEHYLSVVASTFSFGTGHEVEGYRYTVASHHFRDADGDDDAAATAAADAGGPPPHVRWSFALSPLAIRVSEHRKPLYRFLVEVAAIVGGGAALLGLLDAALHGAVRTLRVKRSLGKQM